jgi:putative DNA primase/helicase
VRKTNFAAGVERFAQADRRFAITQDDWNKDNYLFATPGGTVELRAGKLRTADPVDRISKIAAVTPLEKAECPLWLTFLNEATGGDIEVVAFLKRWFGYCLTGDTREHALVFCCGPGGNGKSVLLSTVTRILGDYARVAAMETFVDCRFDRHSTDLAMLAGARLVTASETEEGRAWAESKLKQLTGGDQITARFMRQDNFTYKPRFKLMIIGNHEPTLKSVDDAARRRFNVIPFVHKPPKPDPELSEKLYAEAGGILRWMIEGCLEWQKYGLAQPEAVRVSTEAYFESQDVMGQWLEEKCCVEQGSKRRSNKSDTSANLFASWTGYAKASGEHPGTRKAFAKALERRGFVMFRKDGPGTRAWRGLYVRPSRDEMSGLVSGEYPDGDMGS